ncbi:MAG: ferrochelatase, partial [Gemmatimonadota bacterium]
MKIGVILLNFGEPERTTPAEVIPFLERIFLTNASLEGDASPEEARRRSRVLAEARAPGLIEEYGEIGGSPLNRQARGQADALAVELERRGYEVRTWVGFQFTDPLIPDVVARARETGVDALVGLPVYPLCGPSTTIAALTELRAAVERLGWDVPLHEISGWHRHPDYAALRADGVRELCDRTGVDLSDPGTTLVFSAHGTPIKYLREGSRYDEYVRENCRDIAALLGVPGEDYALGYQNHTNRPVEWTEPDIEDVIDDVAAGRVVVVVPISFMHEQSETLAELDDELREKAEARGLAFHRVPVPHDDPRFAALLADLVEPLLGADNPAGLRYGECRCRGTKGAVCLNV